MTSQEQIKESPSIDLQATSEADSSGVESCESDSQCSNSKTVTFEAESDEDAEYADGIDYSLTGSEKSDKMAKNGHFCGPDGAHKNCSAAENASGDSPHSGCYKWQNPFRVVRKYRRNKSRNTEKPASAKNVDRDQNDRPKRYVKKKITGFDD